MNTVYDWRPGTVLPHTREFVSILMRCAAGLSISFGVFLAGLWFEGALRATISGAGLCGCAVMLWVMRKADGKAQAEWKLYEDTQRAKLKPVTVEKTRVPFPPESFVKFLFDNLTDTGEFPTVEICVDKTKGNFPRPSVVEWFEQANVAGAIQGRIERQKAGRPALAWPKERWIQAARDAATLPI